MWICLPLSQVIGPWSPCHDLPWFIVTLWGVRQAGSSSALRSFQFEIRGVDLGPSASKACGGNPGANKLMLHPEKRDTPLVVVHLFPRKWWSRWEGGQLPLRDHVDIFIMFSEFTCDLIELNGLECPAVDWRTGSLNPHHLSGWWGYMDGAWLLSQPTSSVVGSGPQNVPSEDSF